LVSPFFFWAVGYFPRRTILKEIISILTLISLSMLIGQFFLSRGNCKRLNLPRMWKVVKFHKIFGYIFIGFLLLHPFLIVVPRYFESGVEPLEAFTTLLTTFNSTGVILGIIAWLLMLIIGITSVFRKQVTNDVYKLAVITWNILNNIHNCCHLGHAINLGRHTNVPMSIFILIIATSGIALLLKTYFSIPQNKLRQGHE